MDAGGLGEDCVSGLGPNEGLGVADDRRQSLARRRP